MTWELRRKGAWRTDPMMTSLPSALCLDPESGAVVGWWEKSGVANFPHEWGYESSMNYITVPIPEWLMEYSGSPFCKEVPRPADV